MPWWISLIVALTALVSSGFGVAAALAPQRFAPDDEVGRHYALLYAARAVPLGVAIAVVVWFAPSAGTVALLVVGALAQLADIVIAARGRMWAVVPGASLGAAALIAAILWSLLGG